MNIRFARSFVSLSVLALVFVGGCQVEHPPTREDIKQQKLDTAGNRGLPRTAASTVDDAALVLQACGRPQSDQVLAIFDKLQNGPVRRMIYAGRQFVTIDFIPSVPIARKTYEAAPFPQRKLLLALPNGSVWRFDEARMQKEEFLTTDRLGIYLPCAAKALHREY